ncbi:hypothetical protein BDQ17DRAFT_1355714 [Cyathus striatus]|nr:hypothetical protein BDQ17DRAFT_1355714 [Cyathus striatus]
MSFRCKSCMRDFKNLRDCMAHEKHCAITPSQRDESMASQPSITTYRANMARQFFQSELGDNDISNNSKCSDSVSSSDIDEHSSSSSSSNNIEYDDDISDVDEEHYRILSCPKMEDVYTVLKEHPDGYLTSEFLSGIHLGILSDERLWTCILCNSRYNQSTVVAHLDYHQTNIPDKMQSHWDDIQKLFKIEYDDILYSDDDGNKENIPPMRDAIEHTDEMLKLHPDGYITSTFLESLNVGISEEDNLWLCISCRSMHDVEGIEEHLHQHGNEIPCNRRFIWNDMQLSYNILSGEDDRNPSQMCDISPEEEEVYMQIVLEDRKLDEQAIHKRTDGLLSSQLLDSLDVAIDEAGMLWHCKLCNEKCHSISFHLQTVHGIEMNEGNTEHFRCLEEQYGIGHVVQSCEEDTTLVNISNGQHISDVMTVATEDCLRDVGVEVQDTSSVLHQTLCIEDYEDLLEMEEGLHSNTFLDSYNLSVLSNAGLWVCTSCKNAHTRTGVIAHLLKHSRKLPKESLPYWEYLQDQYSICTRYPVLRSDRDNLNPFPILDIEEEYGCSACDTSGSRQYLARFHIPKCKGAKLISGISTQTFHKGISKKKFRVIPRSDRYASIARLSPAQVWHDIYAANQKQEIDTCREAPNARLVSPWLMRTGWHKMVANHQWKDLKQQVLLPSADEGKQIDDTELQVMFRLNSPNAPHVISHKPFRQFHQVDNTIAQYSVTVVHLIATVIRNVVGNCKFKLEDSMELSNAVWLLCDNRTLECLHNVLSALWLRNWAPATGAGYLNPTVTFLGLYSIKEKGEFKHPKDVTGDIAKLFWGIKMVTLTEVKRRRHMSQQSEMDIMLELQPWVSSNNSSTFSDLTSLQHYATSIAMSTQNLPKVIFPNRHDNDYSVLLFNGKTVTVDNMRQIYTNIQTDILALWEKITFNVPMDITYHILHDNLSSTTPGYSLFDEDTNPFIKSKDVLMDHILTDPQLFNRFFLDSSHMNVHEAREWLLDLAKLELLLLISVALKSGAPIRMTELISSHFRNRDTRPRNLVGVGPRLSLVRQYSKTSNNEQQDRVIPHAISAFETDILLKNLGFVRPVAQFFAKYVWPLDSEVGRKYSEVLFMGFGDLIDAEDASRYMGVITSIVLGWKITISVWRHVNIAWKQNYEIMSVIHAQQSGHSVRTEYQIYGIDGDSLRGIAEDIIAAYLDASNEFQKVFGIPIGGLCLPFNQVRMEDFDSLVMAGKIVLRKDKGDTNTEILAALQELKTCHETSFHLLYQEVNELRQTIAMLTHSPLVVSHLGPDAGTELDVSQTKSDILPTSIIEVVPAREEYECAPGVAPLPSIALEDLERHQNHVTDAPDMLVYLRKLYGTDASWTIDEQRDAVYSMMALEQDVFVVLKTGVGKTAIALIPSMHEDGYSVIIIPLISLLEDWKRRMASLGIGYEHFEGAGNPQLTGDFNIILVSSDVVMGDSWISATASLRKNILRFIFDEVHLYFTDRDFRPKPFLHAYTLRSRHPCQMVLMSATIPRNAREWLSTEFILKDPILITSSCARPELKYVIMAFHFGFTSMVNNVKRWISQTSMLYRWSPEDRYLVFVKSVVQAKSVAEHMNLNCYHANSTPHPISDEDRKSRMEDFLAGKDNKIGLVCTSALSAGFDYRHVRATIHVGTPPDMIMAGRDGKLAHCMVVPNGRSTVQNAFSEMRLTKRWPSTCIRFQMSLLLDGQGKDCLALGLSYQTCSTCDDHQRGVVVAPKLQSELVKTISVHESTAVQDSSKTVQKRRLEDAFGPVAEKALKRSTVEISKLSAELEIYTRFLKKAKGQCGACNVHGISTTGSLHSLDFCPSIQNFENHLFIVGNITYPRMYLGKPWVGPCWSCHVHSFGSNTLHLPFTNPRIHPIPETYMIGFLIAIWEVPTLRSSFASYLGQTWHSIADYKRCIETPLGPSRIPMSDEPKTVNHRTVSMAAMVWWQLHK